MGDKQELLKKIAEKESQLIKAERESTAWNRGKYKTSSNANMSKMLVESLRKEIAKLKLQLDE